MRAGRAPRPTAAAAPAQEGRTLLPDLLSEKKENRFLASSPPPDPRWTRIHRRRGSPPHTGHSATSLSPTQSPHKTFHLARRGRCRCPSGRGTKAVSGGGACFVIMPDNTSLLSMPACDALVFVMRCHTSFAALAGVRCARLVMSSASLLGRGCGREAQVVEDRRGQAMCARRASRRRRGRGDKLACASAYSVRPLNSWPSRGARHQQTGFSSLCVRGLVVVPLLSRMPLQLCNREQQQCDSPRTSVFGLRQQG